MDPAILFLFGSTLFAVAIVPGPAVFAILARALGAGANGAAAFCVGLLLGDLVWFTLAILGMAALASTYALAFVLVKWLGAAYLVYMAWGLWSSQPSVADPNLEAEVNVTSTLSALLSGWSINLSNPKAIIFYLALMPNLVPMGSVTISAYFQLVAVVVAVLLSINGSYAFLAVRARRLVTSHRHMQRLNRGAGLGMIGVAAAMIAR